MADWKPLLRIAENNNRYIYVFVNGEEFGGTIRKIYGYDDILHLVIPAQKTSYNPNGQRNIFINIMEIDVVTFDGDTQ